MGYISEFIRLAASKSQLLAHQLIWNMRTNMFKDEDSQEPDGTLNINYCLLSKLILFINLVDLHEALQHLTDSIIESLSGSSKEFYEREFDFFGKITAISGEIRNFPKGQERKEALLKALKTIKVQSGCYLPSNAEALVIDIDPEKGIPLQSAAKAPFLARFKVVRCGINELETIAMKSHKDQTRPHSTKSLGPELWQAAIFKVGDDVRQVNIN